MSVQHCPWQHHWHQEIHFKIRQKKMFVLLRLKSNVAGLYSSNCFDVSQKEYVSEHSRHRHTVSVVVGNDLSSHRMPGDTTEMRLSFYFQSGASKHSNLFWVILLGLEMNFLFFTAPLGVVYEYLESCADNYPRSIGAFSFQTPWSFLESLSWISATNKPARLLSLHLRLRADFNLRLPPRSFPKPPMCACVLMFVFNECLMSAW